MDHFNWYDYWRLLNIVATATCLIVLLVRYARFRYTYNEKTLDYWYSLTMWTLAGLVGSIMAIVMNAPDNLGEILTTAAAVVSLKGLLNHSSWGGPG